MNTTESKTEIGTFDCVSGILRVTDPCYSRETWCSGTIEDCRTGKWSAEIERQNYGNWGNRIVRLTVTHIDGGTGPEDTADFEVGVDSGQAGVFDDAHYSGEDSDYDGGFYDECCRLTLSKKGAGVVSNGAVSCSGFGDGGYQAFYRRDNKGKCFSITIVFIGDDE